MTHLGQGAAEVAGAHVREHFVQLPQIPRLLCPREGLFDIFHLAAMRTRPGAPRRQSLLILLLRRPAPHLNFRKCVDLIFGCNEIYYTNALHLLVWTNRVVNFVAPIASVLILFGLRPAPHLRKANRLFILP